MCFYMHPDCHMKCHKDDTEKVDLIQPCVAGKLWKDMLLFEKFLIAICFMLSSCLYSQVVWDVNFGSY